MYVRARAWVCVRVYPIPLLGGPRLHRREAPTPREGGAAAPQQRRPARVAGPVSGAGGVFRVASGVRVGVGGVGGLVGELEEEDADGDEEAAQAAAQGQTQERVLQEGEKKRHEEDIATFSVSWDTSPVLLRVPVAVPAIMQVPAQAPGDVADTRGPGQGPGELVDIRKAADEFRIKYRLALADCHLLDDTWPR